VSLLQVENLKKYFGEVHAVDGVSFEISRGEAVSLVGPNGAGKTTLINLLSGKYEPDEGKILFEGENITGKAPYLLTDKLSRSFQIVSLFDNLTTLDNVRCGIFSREGKSKKIFYFIDKDADVTKEALDILRPVLFDKMKISPANMPHPFRKWLDVCVAITMRPKLILLDEPTSGISKFEKEEYMEQLMSIIKRQKVTLLMVEHDIDVVIKYTSRVLVMDKGKLIADGKPNEVLASEEVKSVW